MNKHDADTLTALMLWTATIALITVVVVAAVWGLLAGVLTLVAVLAAAMCGAVTIYKETA